MAMTALEAGDVPILLPPKIALDRRAPYGARRMAEGAGRAPPGDALRDSPPPATPSPMRSRLRVVLPIALLLLAGCRVVATAIFIPVAVV